MLEQIEPSPGIRVSIPSYEVHHIVRRMKTETINCPFPSIHKIYSKVKKSFPKPSRCLSTVQPLPRVSTRKEEIFDHSLHHTLSKRDQVDFFERYA